jgi:hypothetical protein
MAEMLKGMRDVCEQMNHNKSDFSRASVYSSVGGSHASDAGSSSLSVNHTTSKLDVLEKPKDGRPAVVDFSSKLELLSKKRIEGQLKDPVRKELFFSTKRRIEAFELLLQYSKYKTDEMQRLLDEWKSFSQKLTYASLADLKRQHNKLLSKGSQLGRKLNAPFRSQNQTGCKSDCLNSFEELRKFFKATFLHTATEVVNLAKDKDPVFWKDINGPIRELLDRPDLSSEIRRSFAEKFIMWFKCPISIHNCAFSDGDSQVDKQFLTAQNQRLYDHFHKGDMPDIFSDDWLFLYRDELKTHLALQSALLQSESEKGPSGQKMLAMQRLLKEVEDLIFKPLPPV